MPNRRAFLKRGSLTLAATALVPPWRHTLALGRPHVGTIAPRRSGAIGTIPRAGDPLLHTLAMRALDAARSAGALYADVRLTFTRTQQLFSGTPMTDEEHVAAGVRALVDGFWGFVASPEWTPDEMTRLGREAAAQAKVNNWGATRTVELGVPPPSATGSWSTPIQRDPFAVSDEEKMDDIHAAQAYAATFRNGSASSLVSFKREERTFASTDGAFCTQTLYTALGDNSYFSVDTYDPVTNQSGSRLVDWFCPTAGGYEVLTDPALLDSIPQLYEEACRQLSPVPVPLGRTDVVFDAMAMADIVSQSIGTAAEIDRVRGYEANAGGTSYLSPPATALGSQLGTPFLTVTANRSFPRGAATVRWDDDGVVPDAFPIVQQGVVVDYATSREHVPLLAPWYHARSMPVRSHGCANSGSAADVPLVHTPNLQMAPSAASSATFADLVASLRNGLAVVGGNCRMDYRQLTGAGRGEVVYRVVNGELGPVVQGGTYLIRATEFWKNVAAIGGSASLRWRGMDAVKGEPPQQTSHSVEAVPALVQNVVFVDEARTP